MIRLFDTHHVRKSVELEGCWDFEPMHIGDSLPGRYHFRLPVPGVWEMHPEFSAYRGLGAFRRQIHTSSRENLMMTFDGVSHTANVFFDGEPVRHHYNAYTGFSLVVPEVAAGDHEIVVTVDNRFGADSTLHIANDYYTYGGIIRPVALARVPKVFVDGLRFIPSGQGDAWTAEIAVGLKSCVEGAKPFRIEVELAGKRLVVAEGTVDGSKDTQWYDAEMRFEAIDAWSPAHPRLYELTAHLFLGENPVLSDDLIDRVGFRTISLEGDQIQINGEKVVLRGLNRHEDYPGVGAAIPFPLMVQDLELLKDLGANAVRTSHYPNDQRFLDLCDENGLLVWEEHHARGLDLNHMQQPGFREQITDSTTEMLTQHLNHPAIVIWGVFNECASDTRLGRDLYAEQMAIIRSFDLSRPLTYATHHRDRDLCFDLADIVSFNLYPLWYGDERPEDLFALTRRWADQGGGKGKPIIISEMGADGFYGFREPRAGQGTEERQAEILAADITAALEQHVAGMFIWQFADCRVSETGSFRFSRAMGQNSKGVVDRYRRPKLAYEAVRRLYRQDAGESLNIQSGPRDPS
ncbi:MAG: beta-glucuronidase [Firmicutes bacterium]|nr:beta-glucuronidase [Bacillota bacterium]